MIENSIYTEFLTAPITALFPASAMESFMNEDFDAVYVFRSPEYILERVSAHHKPLLLLDLNKDNP